jgi:hypothetical protein
MKDGTICGSTRKRLTLRSYRPDKIDPKFRGIDYPGFITRCPKCGAQGMVNTKRCEEPECGEEFEYIVSALNCRPRRFCDDPDCGKKRHKKTMKAWRADQVRRQGETSKK